jgi:FKBP-type peptidyl-prolyl cis-trans isomerase (trigger factor)
MCGVQIVKLGMLFRDVAEKESIAVTEKEIQEQLDLLAAQARQKGEAPPDQSSARYVRRDFLSMYLYMYVCDVVSSRDEIENTLLRRKVFDCLAGYATITWVEEAEAEVPPQQAQ